jgi:O-antigen/teichoic acid export membrane protein
MSVEGRPIAATLVRNAFYGGGARVITLAVGLIMTPYLLSRLGAERFGIWALVAVVTGAVGLLDFSLRTAVVKFLAESVALGDRRVAGRILSTALLAYALFALLVGAAFFAAGSGLLSLFRIPPALAAETGRVFTLGVAGYLLGTVLSVFPALCDAHQRMDITNALGVVALLVGTALTVLAVEAGFGLPGVAWAQLAGIALFHLACIGAARRLAGPLGLALHHVDRTCFARLFAFGWRLHVSAMCGVVNRQFDKLILARWAGLGVVGAYEVALRAAANLGSLQPYLAAALLPASSQMHAAGRHDELLAVYRQSTRYLFLVGIPPFVFLALFSQPVVTAWLGAPNPLAALILACLVPGYLVNSLSNAMAFVCQGVGQPGIQARQSALQLGLNVVLSLLLLYLMGPLGAPIGTSIALVLGAAWFAWAFHRHLGLRTLPMLRESALLPLAASLLGAGAAWLATASMAATTRADALPMVAVGFAVFSLVVLAIYLGTRQLGWRELRMLVAAMRAPAGAAKP